MAADSFHKQESYLKYSFIGAMQAATFFLMLNNGMGNNGKRKTCTIPTMKCTVYWFLPRISGYP